MTGVIATTVVAHVPTLGLAKNTPAYQETLVAAERAMGAALRSVLKPDLWVVISTHWVATFNWLVTMQAMHDGVLQPTILQAIDEAMVGCHPLRCGPVLAPARQHVAEGRTGHEHHAPA